MKGNTRLGLILAVFAAVGCASLAVVYAVTKPRIEVQEQLALTTSLKEIFPEAVSFEDITSNVTSGDPGVKFLSVMLVKGSMAPLGVAVKAAASSYGGQATLLVGVQLNRSIAGVRVLELNDTPGLGANAKNSSYYVKKAEKITFPGQFAGKFITDPFEVKKDVAAITAATITSRSLTRIVKAAATSAAAWLENSTVTSVAPDTPAAGAAGTTGGK